VEQYNHIEIKRVEKAQDYRFRSFPNAPRPPERDVATHSIKLRNQLKSSSCEILDKRKEANIGSEKLMVLELNSIALSPDKLEQMFLKFNMSLVEEVKIPKNEAVRLLVQFDDLDDIEAFDKERSL
jgi:hypothetical protein